MVGPNKILTVSYGTFSCTLEGFEDPFNTMKAIAEYFRDLAAEDRYFGAEPPVPDAAMLHRIAEREIQRRVEARVQDGGVLLRAAEAPAEAAPAAAAPPPQPAPAMPRLHAPSPSVEESVAAKLARIRAAVDRARSAPAALAEIEEAEEVPPAPAAVARPAPVEAAPVAAAPGAVIAKAEPAAGEAPEAVAAPAAEAEAPAAPAAVAEAAPHAADEPAAAVEPSAEAAAAEEPPASPLAVAEAAAGVADAPAPAAAGEAPAAPAHPRPAHGGEDADLAALSAAVSGAADPAVEPDAEAILPPAAPPAPLARVVKVRREEAAILEPALLSPEEEDELARELAAVEREIAATAARATPVPAAAPESSAPAAPGDEAVSRLIAQTNSELEGPETRRRAATIAHLKAAVAATEAERAAGAVPGDGGRAREEAYREDLAEAVRPRRPSIVPGAGLRRPEGGARIPPLVLVSALRVDRPATPAAAPAAEAAPVRPRRVTAGSLALTEDVEDDDTIAEAAPDANIFAPTARFAEAVERLGAGQLPDLIEAAAAYLVALEGRESFSRPQVMRLAGSVAGEEAVAREDGLRAFGALLRDGRIVKARRGQFALSDGNRMLAEMRAFAR